MKEKKHLLRKLHHLTHLMQRVRSQRSTSANFNMADGKGFLLSELYKQDGLTQRELSEVLDIRPSSVGELIRKLEIKNWVMRKNNEQDRRVMNVFLTAQGRKVVEETADIETGIHSQMFQNINQEDLSYFTNVLDRMICSLEEGSIEDEHETSGYHHRHRQGGLGRGCCIGKRNEKENQEIK